MERSKLEKIAVHDGVFHPDELFALAILKNINPGIEIIRTRDPNKLSKADARVDVGRKYNPNTHDYDHHQEEGAGKRENGILYASAGLIWKHFGHDVAKTQDCFDYLDEKILQSIDAEDNGIMTYDIINANPYTFSSSIISLNNSWRVGKESVDSAFNRALSLTELVLNNELIKGEKSAEHKPIIISKLKEFENKPYVILDKDYFWEQFIIKNTNKLFVILPINGSNTWAVYSVPSKTYGFDLRKPFPDSWRGLAGNDLAEVTGVSDAIFCHNKGFITVAESKEGAKKLADIATEYSKI